MPDPKDELAQLDARRRLVVTAHHSVDGAELRTIERADLHQHEILLTGPFVETNAPIDSHLDRASPRRARTVRRTVSPRAVGARTRRTKMV